MSLIRISEPSAEPVSLAEAKAHLRVDGTDEDTYITTLIAVARQQAEHELQRTLMASTWERVLDDFPDGEIELRMPPVQSITSVTYIDGDGATQTLESSAYSLDTASHVPWLLPAYDTDWPATLDTANAVRVRYVAGYANAAAVPAAIRQWLLLQIGQWYASREASSDRAATPLPFASGLLDPYRVWGV